MSTIESMHLWFTSEGALGAQKRSLEHLMLILIFHLLNLSLWSH